MTIAVAEIAIEQLGEKVEIRPALLIEKIHSLAPLEFEDRIFTFLDGPWQE
jgi:hypothetical protein